MSTICLAAQRSYTTGEPVWFSWRLPSFSKMFSVVTLWCLGMCALMENMPINSDENDWQQAPDGTLPDSSVTHDTSRDTLPGTEAHEQATTSEDDGALKALLMQALKQQQDDMAKGKMPAPPVDETQNASPSVIKGDAGGD